VDPAKRIRWQNKFGTVIALAKNKRNEVKLETCCPTTEEFVDVGKNAMSGLISVFRTLLEETHD
jgi:hypothetical protein